MRPNCGCIKNSRSEIVNCREGGSYKSGNIFIPCPHLQKYAMTRPSNKSYR